MKRKRLLAALIAGLTVAALLAACCFLALEAEHDCPGEGCHICAQLGVCMNLLRTFFISLSVAALFVLCAAARPALRAGGAAAFPTPVSLKIRLLD
jgi:hypothetical protein